MLQLGHILALGVLTSKGKRPITVNLVLANADLVQHYQELFAEKQSLADPRVHFEWLSMDLFRK